MDVKTGRNNPGDFGVLRSMRLRYCGRVLRALALLSLATVAANAQQTYFPANTFDSILETWFSAELRIFGEPSLLELSRDTSVESYRFLWLRTFNEPIAVRLDVKPDGTGTITTKVATGEAGFPYTSKTLSKNTSSPVPRERVQSFLRQVDELGFWSLATSLKGDQNGTDGSEWIVEGSKGGKYHIAERWCADKRASKRVIYQLGVSLALGLAQLRIPKKDIY
jgi:hypothetical protein